MKSLLVATLLAPLATGCIITSDGYTEEVGYINTEWSFHAVDGSELACPAGFPTVEVSAIPYDGGPAIIDLYNCNRKAASAPYPIGEYDVTIAITNNSGSQEYAHSLTQYVDIFSADASLGEDFIHDGGRLLFDWTLVDAKTNASLDCRAAANPTIKVDVATPEAVVSTDLLCSDGFGVSNPVLAGDYVATIFVADKAGQPLGAPLTKDVKLKDRNDYDDLGSLALPVGTSEPAPQ